MAEAKSQRELNLIVCRNGPSRDRSSAAFPAHRRFGPSVPTAIAIPRLDDQSVNYLKLDVMRWRVVSSSRLERLGTAMDLRIDRAARVGGHTEIAILYIVARA